MADVKTEIYVDGSFFDSDPTIVYGGVVVLANKKLLALIRVSSRQTDLVKMRNIGGELLSAIKGLSTIATACKGLNATVRIYHDYNGIAYFTKLGTRTFNPGKGKIASQRYKVTMDSLIDENPNLSIKFTHTPGHSGIEWNEVADGVAKGTIQYYKGVKVSYEPIKFKGE